MNGRKLSLKTPHHAVKSGLALVPEERRKEGILVQESVATNLTAASIGKFSKIFSFVDRKAEKKKRRNLLRALVLKPLQRKLRLKTCQVVINKRSLSESG